MTEAAYTLETRDGTTRVALVIIAVVVGGAALWWLRGILTPLVLAIFLLVMIDGLARVIEHRVPGFPKAFAMPVALAIAVVGFGLTVYLLAESATGFVAQLVTYGPKLHALIDKLAGQFGIAVPPTAGEMMQQINPQRFLGPVAQNLQGFAHGRLLRPDLSRLPDRLAARLRAQDRGPVPDPRRARGRRRGVHPHPRRRRAVPVGPDRHRPDDRRRLLGGDGGGRPGQRRLLGLPDLHRLLHPDGRRAGRR